MPLTFNSRQQQQLQLYALQQKYNDTCAAWLLRVTLSTGHAQTGDTDDEVISEVRGDYCGAKESMVVVWIPNTSLCVYIVHLDSWVTHLGFCVDRILNF